MAKIRSQLLRTVQLAGLVLLVTGAPGPHLGLPQPATRRLHEVVTVVLSLHATLRWTRAGLAPARLARSLARTTHLTAFSLEGVWAVGSRKPAQPHGQIRLWPFRLLTPTPTHCYSSLLPCGQHHLTKDSGSLSKINAAPKQGYALLPTWAPALPPARTLLGHGLPFRIKSAHHNSWLTSWRSNSSEHQHFKDSLPITHPRAR